MADSTNASLIANNATSFKLHSRTRRHKQYITNDIEISCFHPIGSTLDPDANCHFVRHNYYCNYDTNGINYLEFAVCTVRIDELSWYGEIGYVVCTIVLLLFIVFSFLIMTKWFILPNLLTLHNWWVLNAYQFGVIVVSTLIVLPILFKSPMACNTPKESYSLLITDSVSKTFTMYGFGLALIGINANLSVPSCRFIANLIMILLANVYVLTLIHLKAKNNLLLKEEQTGLKLEWHAKFFIIVYVIYLFAHLFDPHITAMSRKSVTSRVGSNQSNRSQSQTGASSISIRQIKNAVVNEDVLEEVNGELAVSDELTAFEVNLRAFYGEIFGKNCISLNVLFIPIWIALTLLIPVINENRPFDGWYKYLLGLNLSVTPLLLFGYIRKIDTLICFIIGFVASVTLLCSTNDTVPPRFYKLFGTIGLLAAFMICHLLEKQTGTLIHQCLQYAAGWNLDAATVIASSFFSCATEMIIVSELIKEEKTDIAFGAVTGLAMYNTLMSTFPYIALFQPCFDETSTIFITKNCYTVYVFLFIMIGYTFLGVTISDFELRRSYGIFLFIFCSIFILYLILMVYEFIHPYGSQHSSIFSYNPLAHADWA
ncbi:uncharacterized protein LOC128861612 [Anastrepha ludens]|uniref:uncharacterized protein LOC128861612 n=1 Tax=Anastrepha ludens TaxID=28586 RepID=UPI0023B0BB52|nr:uncharacterized protein LOC128861612 [Anastrepha ludens]